MWLSRFQDSIPPYSPVALVRSCHGRGHHWSNTEPVGYRERDRRAPNVLGAWLAPAGRIIELAHLRAADESGHLGAGADQRRTTRVPGVADGNPSVGQLCYFDAAAARVAVTALLPDDLGRKGRRAAIVAPLHPRLSPSSATRSDVHWQGCCRPAAQQQSHEHPLKHPLTHCAALLTQRYSVWKRRQPQGSRGRRLGCHPFDEVHHGHADRGLPSRHMRQLRPLPA